MSTEMISTVAETKYHALRPDSAISAASSANLMPGERISASLLPRVPTPTGGSKVWSWTDAGNNEQSAKSIDGILVYYGVRGVLWGSEDPQVGVQPVLMTYDLMTATRMNDDVGDLDPDVLESCRIGDRTYDWQKLPYNKYGSASNGRGRRCKESRVMAILREEEAWPLLVTAGPGSLATVAPFVMRLAVPHYQAEVSLTLQKVENAGGQPYSQIVPKLLGTLSVEEGQAVKRMYTDPLSRIATEIDNNGPVA